MQANIKSGADDNPSNHLQPKVGATANARATSKHAPNAQKHWRKNGKIIWNQIQYNLIAIIHLHLIEQHIWLAVWLEEILRTM